MGKLTEDESPDPRLKDPFYMNALQKRNNLGYGAVDHYRHTFPLAPVVYGAKMITFEQTLLCHAMGMAVELACPL
jgi:hypothetical protein